MLPKSVAREATNSFAAGKLPRRPNLVSIVVRPSQSFFRIGDKQPFFSDISGRHPAAVIDNGYRALIRIELNVDPRGSRVEGIFDELEYRDEIVGDEIAANDVLKV